MGFPIMGTRWRFFLISHLRNRFQEHTDCYWRTLRMPLRSYQELIGWKKSMALVRGIYRSTQSFPKEEIYGLTSQPRRAAVSIPSNIAEGQGRLSRGEFKQFLGHAKGSVFEVETQLLIARDLGYLGDEATHTLLEQVKEVGRILGGLLSSLDRDRTSN
jgi:four helix bundle protein